jgi:hypothetical protein
MTTYFCDGLKDVTILNGAARLEFHRLSPGANGEFEVHSELLVAFPMQGLIQLLDVLDEVRDRLNKDRLLEDPQPAAARHREELETSPNFA